MVYFLKKTELLFVTNVQSNTVTILTKKTLNVKANIKV